MKEVYNFLGIRHVKTSPYRPQSNSNLERFHHTLMQMVRKGLTDKKRLGCLLTVFSLCMSRGTVFSHRLLSIELLYGRHVHGPLDILRQQWLPTKKTSRNTSEWILDLREMLSEMKDTAKLLSKRRLRTITSRDMMPRLETGIIQMVLKFWCFLPLLQANMLRSSMTDGTVRIPPWENLHQ